MLPQLALMEERLAAFTHFSSRHSARLLFEVRCMSKLLLAACCQRLFRMPRRDNTHDMTDMSHDSAAPNSSTGAPTGQSRAAQGRTHGQSKPKAHMSPMVEEEGQEENELEPDFQNYGTRRKGSATYIWPRLGASAEDNINGELRQAIAGLFARTKAIGCLQVFLNTLSKAFALTACKQGGTSELLFAKDSWSCRPGYMAQ